MTPTVLVLNLALAFAGMAALCLSMDRHYAAAFLVKPRRSTALALRLSGWGALALCFGLAVLLEGWNFGPVQWIGALTGAALLVVALLSYRPGWIRPAAILALPLALAAAWAL